MSHKKAQKSHKEELDHSVAFSLMCFLCLFVANGYEVPVS